MKLQGSRAEYQLDAGENFIDSDMINFQNIIWDKVIGTKIVVKQFVNNSHEQIMLGNYPDATINALFESQEA